MARLTTAQRNRLPRGAFAIPGKREYPIEDKAHAENALSRVSAFGTPAEKREVRDAVHRRYPSMGRMDDGGPVQVSGPYDLQEGEYVVPRGALPSLFAAPIPAMGRPGASALPGTVARLVNNPSGMFTNPSGMFMAAPAAAPRMGMRPPGDARNGTAASPAAAESSAGAAAPIMTETIGPAARRYQEDLERGAPGANAGMPTTFKGKFLRGLEAAAVGALAGKDALPAAMDFYNAPRREAQADFQAQLGRDRELAGLERQGAQDARQAQLDELNRQNVQSEIAERGDTQKGKWDLERDPQGNVIGARSPKGEILPLDDPSVPPGLRSVADANKPRAVADTFNMEAELRKEHPDWTPEQIGQEAKKLRGAGGTMSPYALSRIMGMAYEYDPRLMPLIPAFVKQLGDDLGFQLPEGFDLNGTPAGQPRDTQGNAIGLRQPEAPTSAVRTRGQMAGDALTVMPQIRQEVQAMADELGPVAGRWQEFLTGRLGADNPQFAKLRDDLLGLASSFARAHLNTEAGLKPFEEMMSAGKMSPGNILAALDSVQQFLESYQKTGAGNQPGTAKGGGFAAWKAAQGGKTQ